MASSPVKYLIGFLVACAVVWVAVVFSARLLAWLLSRIIGVSIGFQVAGCNCLRDILVTFRKGAVESILIGEVKLSLRESLIKLGFNIFSRDQTLQLLVSDLDVFLRSPAQGIKKNKPRSSHSLGRGTWIFMAKVVRLLSVFVTELNVKGSKTAVQVKGLRVDASKHGKSNPTFSVSLRIVHFAFDTFHQELIFDQSSNFMVEKPAHSEFVEKKLSPFLCQDISLVCELVRNREHGVKFGNLDVTCGEITMNLKDNLFVKKESHNSIGVDGSKEGGLEDILVKNSENSKNLPLSVKKNIFAFPEKVSFNIQKLDVKFMLKDEGIFANNTVTGILLRSTKSVAYDDSEATSCFSLNMDFSEIFLLREGISSAMEFLEVSVTSTVDVPMQTLPIRVEVDVKISRVHCDLICSRLRPWLCLKFGKQKQMVLREESLDQDKMPMINMNTIMWRCTISALEGCLKFSHICANNMASKRLELYAELGGFHLNTADVYLQSLKKKLFGVEISSGSLVYFERMSLDLGHREMESHDELDLSGLKLVLAVDIIGMGVFFEFKHVESLTKTIISLKELLKGISSSSKKPAKYKGMSSSMEETTKGINIVKLSLERCSIKYFGDISLEEMTVADPMHVNFGSQGGEVLISVSADGKPRKASITSMRPSGCQHLKFTTSLDILHLRFGLNKEKHSMEIEIDRALSFYSEYPKDENPGAEVTLLDMQKAKFVHHAGGLNDIAFCSLLNVTDLSIRWEPDVHLALHQSVTSLRFLLYNQKHHDSDDQIKEITSDQAPSEKQDEKQDSVFAIDVEMLKVSAEIADGVETMIHVQSIFSENVRIGVLIEEIMIAFNEARIFRSSCLQISHVPVSVIHNLMDSKSQMATTCDWIIQSPDIYICMPYRLQLRAIDDAVEDMLRGLNLMTAAKTDLISPGKKHSTGKDNSSSTKFGSVRLIIRKLTAEIEEEPIQGWLDEHYQLMKKEICEAAVRLRFLNELLSSKISTSDASNAPGSDKKIHPKGIELDAYDISSVEVLQTEIHKKIFRSYYEACQKIVISKGSGASTKGFQSGFKPSITRDSLVSLCASELDVTLTQIDKGNVGILEFIKRIDPICSDNDIPFARMYGRDIVLSAGSLVLKIRNYTYPLFCASSGKCQGRIVLAQQATSFQPQILRDVFIGRWWRVRMLCSSSGTAPPMKLYFDLPISFHKGEVSFGVGYEPAFADVSYAFTVAFHRANLGSRSFTVQNGTRSSQMAAVNSSEQQLPRRERSLPWWDDIRYYIHGKIDLSFTESRWIVFGTTNPYEKLDKLEVVSAHTEIQQRDGRLCLSTREFKVYLSSLESLVDSFSLKPPSHVSGPFLVSPTFVIEVLMEWGCESGNPLDHYLHSLPIEGKPRMRVYDRFRSTSLLLKWNFSLKPFKLTDNELASSFDVGNNTKPDGSMYESSQRLGAKSINCPTVNLCAHDLVWLFKFWNLIYLPPHKLRCFSSWPRFGVPRVARSHNLSLDKVMTEFFLRLDITRFCIYHTISTDDPAIGMALKMTKLKCALCFSRGKQQFTSDCKRESLDLVYQGLDIHMLTVYLDQINGAPIARDIKTSKRSSKSEAMDKFGNKNCSYGCEEKRQDDGFLLYSDYFTVRRQTSKADPPRLLAWQEYGRKNLEMTCDISKIEHGSESDHARLDLINDDGFNVVAENCQRVFVYDLKILWTLENRNAFLSFVGGISKAFEPPKPSPSKQNSQRKLIENQKTTYETAVPCNEAFGSMPSVSQCESSTSVPHVKNQRQDSFHSFTSSAMVVEHGDNCDTTEEGICHFMVTIIQPQFNLHSEEAKGRFLLAAASGRVLARSFRSIFHVGHDIIEKSLSTRNVAIPDNVSDMTWKRVELSMMLEHVQAHVAPTDVDPDTGLQWLPRILSSSPNVKHTGPLLERVFMPCQMCFRFAQYKGGTSELKVKPLKELTFNSPNITAEMTSHQFQVLLDVLSNLLFPKLPKLPKSSLLCPSDDEDTEDEAYDVDGGKEIDLAKINLEQWRREQILLLSDIKTLAVTTDMSDGTNLSPENGDLWILACAKSTLVQELKKELGNIRNSIKEASSTLRLVLQKAAQLRVMEKENNKSPSCAIRFSVSINKVVWSMLADDKSFAEAEINDMIYDFEGDYKDIGIAQLTTKSFFVRNCTPNAKSDMLLSPWNPPPEWGKSVMLNINAKQGAPKDGSSPVEFFQVDIYPLTIYLTETMYNMMWRYFFPEEEQHSLKEQEIWKVSTTVGSKQGKENLYGCETIASSSQSSKESDSPGRSSTIKTSLTSGAVVQGDSSRVTRMQNPKATTVSGSNPELRRTSSFGRTWAEIVADSVADELVLQVHSSSISSSQSHINVAPEFKNPSAEESFRNKLRDFKPLRSSHLSYEEKKDEKSHDESRCKKMKEFHNVRISQVELLVTYEGSRIAFSDLRFLIDQFDHGDFTGTWRRLFAQVKKHIVSGVLNSVAGMQGKELKEMNQNQREAHEGVLPENNFSTSDSNGDQPPKSDKFPTLFLEGGSDGAADGFVTSVRGSFNSQHRKAKAYVLRTMRDEADHDHGEWSDGDVELGPFAGQLTVAKIKKLIQQHSNKFRTR